MNMNGILEQIETFNINDAMSVLDEAGHVLTQTETVVLAVLCVIGVLFALLGLKIVRFWSGLLGLLLGLYGGIMAAYYLGIDEMYVWIPGAVLGIVLAVLGAWKHRFGVFLTVWTSVSSVCMYIIRPTDWMWGIICLAAGLVLALLSVRFVEFLAMLSTAVCGAVLGGTAAYYLIPFEGQFIHIIICVALGIIGFLVQLLIESRKRRKQNLRKAAEIREHQSTANEVEKARALVDELDKETETEEEELEIIQFGDGDDSEDPEEEFDELDDELDLEEDDESEEDIDDLDEESDYPDDDEDEIDYLDDEEETDYLDDEEGYLDDEETDYLDDEEEIDYLDDEETEEKEEK